MADFPDSSQLSDRERAELEQSIELFSLACQTSVEKVVLADFLPPAEATLRVPTLWRLIPKDLERRSLLGERPRLEAYTEEFPELGGRDELPVELLCAEFSVLRGMQEPPQVTDYKARFPRQFDEFRQREQPPGPSGSRSDSTEHNLSHKPSDDETRPDREEIVSPNRTEDKRNFVQGTLVPEVSSTVDYSRKAEASRLPSGSTGPPDVGSAEDFPHKTVGEGRYHLIRPLGQGVYGTVWEAEAPGGVRVAVKMIRFPLGHQMSKQERSSLELIKQLRHPLLLEVQAFWGEHDQLIIVTSLADKTLEDRLEECLAEGKQGVPRLELVEYILDAADAIDYLHKNDVIHRDIKPANILLVDKRAKVGDFGLARVLEQHSEASLAKASSMGTPLYMAPELFEGKASHHTDQYSLATAYAELRTGQAPFHGDSIAAVMRAHLDGKPNLSGLVGLEKKVLEKALAKKTSDRYASCTEFAKALEAAIQPAKHPIATRFAQAGFALLLCAAVGFAVWSLFFRFNVAEISRVPVQAGGRSNFNVAVATPFFSPAPTFSFAAPSGSASFQGEFDGRMLRAKVTLDSLNEPPGEIPVVLNARVGHRSTQRKFLLEIQPPEVYVPEGFVRMPQAPICRSNGRNLYEAIVKHLTGGTEIEFRLIRSEDPPSFYIMKTKVWNALFGQFANERPEELDLDSAWRDGGQRSANGMHPAFNMSVVEANKFATWIGGKLPTQKQWDQASGRYDRADGQIGPFRKDWEPTDKSAIAINRKDGGPLPIGAAKSDISPFGICDMAGNGYEWTRDVRMPGGPTKELSDLELQLDSLEARLAAVYVRGMDYRQAEPLKYDQLESPSYPVNPYHSFDKDRVYFADMYTSFRVVVELGSTQ